MKKFICIMLCVCICVSSTAFSFAEAWNSQEAQNVTNDVNSIKTYIMSFTDSWTTFFETMTGGSPSTLLTFQDLVRDVLAIGDWLAPLADYASGLRPSSMMSIWDTLTNTMSSIVTMQSQLTSWMNTNNGNLNELRKANTNWAQTQAFPWSGTNIWNFAHGALGINSNNGIYTLATIDGSNNKVNTNIAWYQGTPIGNIAAMLRLAILSDTNQYQNVWNAALKDYTGQLGIWDSQGDTLTQEAWSPTSAINGLYKYLAYTQRDVARLTYVLASDEEIQAREEARANQTEVFDNFIDPSGSGSASPSDINSVSDLSSAFKDNIATDASVSGIWNIFNSDNFGWFSQETADQLDTTNSGTRMIRSSGSYPTPLLDQQTEDILKYIGGDDND